MRRLLLCGGLCATLGPTLWAQPFCDSPPVGTPAEIASTPREHSDLERLGIEMTGQFILDEALYQRLAFDLGWIRSRYPETADVEHDGTFDGRTVALAVDDPTLAAMQDGSYDAWDCLNATYGLDEVRLRDYTFGNYAYVGLKGMYRAELLAPSYSALAGVLGAWAYPGGNHRGESLCGYLDSGSTLHYFIVVEAYGDCPAGCIYKDVRYFTARELELPRYQGRWFNHLDAVEPWWKHVFQQCRASTTNPLRATLDVSSEAPVPARGAG